MWLWAGYCWRASWLAEGGERKGRRGGGCVPREAGSLVADWSQVPRHICEVKSTSPGITGTEDGVRGLQKGQLTSPAILHHCLPSTSYCISWDFQLSLHWRLLLLVGGERTARLVLVRDRAFRRLQTALLF